DAFQARYTVPFEVFRNGVTPAQWQGLNRRPSRDEVIRIRYAGSLAPDTASDGVYEVAKAVEEIAAYHRVELEIRTQPTWHETEALKYEPFSHVSFSLADLDIAEYH